MDPASFLGSLNSASAIVKAITKHSQALARLRGKFQEAPTTLRLLLAELSAVKAALVQIEDWAKYNAFNGPVQEELALGLSISLEGCQIAMSLLGEEVARLSNEFGNSEDDFRARLRTVWSDSSMKDHQQRLHGQISALQILLQAVHIQSLSGQAALLREPKNRQIIKKMKDETSSLRAIGPRSSRIGTESVVARTNSTIGSTVFAFDHGIMDSVVYQTNGRRAIAKRTSQRDLEEPVRYPAIMPEGMGSSVLSPPIPTRVTINPPAIQTRGIIPEGIGSSTLSPPTRVPDIIGSVATTTLQNSESWTRPNPYEAPVSEPFPRRLTRRPPLAVISDPALWPVRIQDPRPIKSEGSKASIWASIKRRKSRLSLSFSGKDQNSMLCPVSPSAGFRRGRRRSENDVNRSVDLTSNLRDSIPDIVRAAQEGSVREIEELLDQGAYIEQPTSFTRRTALSVAAHCGNDDIVAVLLQRRADLEVVDSSGMTPLHLAASRGHYRVVELLLHDHAEVDCQTPDQMTPLRLASNEGYEEVATLLLQRDAKVNARDRQHLTALHVAAKAGDVAMVDILVAHGADIEAKDANSMAAVHYAAEAGHTIIVEKLLGKKSNIDYAGAEFKTPLMFACASGHKEVVKLLIKRKASLKQKADGDMTAIHWASYHGHEDIVKLLLQKQRSAIEVRTCDGRTPLHMATMSRSFAVAELLVRKGAFIEAQCSSTKTPLHYACQSGDFASVKLLISSGANMEAETLAGRRPLHIATQDGLKDIAELLITKKASIDALDTEGERPLCLASASGHSDLVQFLLDKGAAMRSKFRAGQSNEDSPLCLAAKHGHVSVVLDLLDRGASARQRDDRNWPPLRYAAHFGHPEVVEILLGSGATVGGISSGNFNMTAEEIGFASSGVTEERKERVLELLHIAEARERAQPPSSPTSPIWLGRSARFGPGRERGGTFESMLTAVTEIEDTTPRSWQRSHVSQVSEMSSDSDVVAGRRSNLGHIYEQDDKMDAIEYERYASINQQSSNLAEMEGEGHELRVRP